MLHFVQNFLFLKGMAYDFFKKGVDSASHESQGNGASNIHYVCTKQYFDRP